MITIALLYKSGGDYKAVDAVKLARAVHRNLTVPHRIVCLTDDVAIEIESVTVGWTLMPLIADLPGWWSKIELFKIHGPVLYFDLDTVITGNIDVLAQWAINASPGEDLLMLRDFYKGNEASGIMGWNGDQQWVFDQFNKHVPAFSGTVLRWNRKRFRGDQEWMRAVVVPRLKIDMAQDIQPGIVSYKVDLRDKGSTTLAEGTSVVCFHGKPRPWEVHPVPQWMKGHWNG